MFYLPLPATHIKTTLYTKLAGAKAEVYIVIKCGSIIRICAKRGLTGAMDKRNKFGSRFNRNI